MSKRSTRNRNTITLDRNELQRLISAEVARRYTPPPQSTVTPISQDILNQMQQAMAPQDKTQGMFAPGAPIKPVPGMAPATGPRIWQYPIGYNIGQLPRSTETTAFQTLRNLAGLYEGIQMCEQVWFDLCSKPELVIKPRDELTQDENGDPIPPAEIQAKYGARIAKWKTFFAKPDQKRSLKRWMRRALKEVLEVDALAIYKRPDRIGRLWGLEIIDGTMIKPLLDERGGEPEDGDYPAYEQFAYGVPAMFLKRFQIIYRREVDRVDSPYGFSRVEKILVRINQALRKENKDLSYFTDGNVPVGFLAPPDDGTTDWTPEQLLMYQTMWDGMLAGNDAIKARIKAIPPGSVYTKTDPDDIMVPFDQFLLNITAGMFGVPMSELSFTETVNKSSGETQEALLYRRTMSTVMDMFGEMFTEVMVDEGENDLEAGWKAFEEPEDLKTKAEAWNILVGNGTQSTSQAAHAMGLKPMFETEPFVITKDGPVFIKDAMDMRQPTMDAKLAGLQFTKDNPGGMQNEQGTQQGQQGAKGAMGGAQGQSGGGKQGNTGGAGKQGQDDSSTKSGSATRSLDTSLPGELEPTERAIAAEYRRWRECAIKDMKAGKPVRWFETTIIPHDDVVRLRDSLRLCATADEVREAFRAKQPPTWEPPDVEDQLGILRSAQVDTVTWQDAPGACSEICLQNAGVTVKLGERFPGGQRVVVGHPHCQCQPIYHKADGTQIAVSTGQEVEF
jgi:hypothetical protein